MKTLIVLVCSMLAGFVLTALAAEVVTWRAEPSGLVGQVPAGDTGLRLVETAPVGMFNPDAVLDTAQIHDLR